METYKGVRILERDNRVAYLISAKVAEPWSTCNKPSLAYDLRVINLWINLRDNLRLLEELKNKNSKVTIEINKIFNDWGYKNVNLLALAYLELDWMDKNIMFKIVQMEDGTEWVEYFDDCDWICFSD